MEFIEILKNHLNKRAKENSSYSLRAFARDLGIDPSNMSKILSGKISPQKSTKEKILIKLGLLPGEISKIIKQENIEFEEKFSQLNLDEFEAVSVWYHDAILELTRLSFFQPSYSWIAKTLDISIIQVKLAVERLQKIGYLKISNDEWIDCLEDNTTNLDSNYTNQALKNLQISLLEKSIEAVKKIDIEERDHTSTMLTINKKDIPEVKKKIKKFRKELACYLERPSVRADSLYQIQIGFYPLIKKEK